MRGARTGQWGADADGPRQQLVFPAFGAFPLSRSRLRWIRSRTTWGPMETRRQDLAGGYGGHRS